LQIVSNIMRFVGLCLFLPCIVAWYYKEQSFAMVFLAMAIFLAVFFSIIHYFLGERKARFKHAIISIAIAWFIIGLFSAIPFVFAGISPVDAFFESVSGWTGTGLTMVAFPEQLPFSINFWRGLIQWIGGFGIVVLALIFYEKPRTAHELFQAEGRTEDFYPSVFKIARTIVLIYFIYTLIGILLFLFSGMGLFDSIVHTFTSIATGGFSTNAIGVGAFGKPAMLITIFLMLLGGISFDSHRALLKGKIKNFFFNPEIRLLIAVILVASGLILVNSFFFGQLHFFDSFFYVVSAITGTGATTIFGVAELPALSVFLLVLLMIFGACYGSTTGALKLWRILIVFKAVRREIYKAFLPSNAIVPIKIGGKPVMDETALSAIAYIALYLSVLVIGSVFFMFAGYGLIESVFTVASAQGNVGLSILSGNAWFGMDALFKILLSFHMILGRMEILPFLIMLKSFGIIRKS
jgi:trk system potassium uptake protein TrkH